MSARPDDVEHLYAATALSFLCVCVMHARIIRIYDIT